MKKIFFLVGYDSCFNAKRLLVKFPEITQYIKSNYVVKYYLLIKNEIIVND